VGIEGPRLARRVPPLFAALAAVAVLAACGSAGDSGGAKEGDRAPDFTLPSTTGRQVSLSQFEGGPVMLYFWASWCGSCTFDLADIERAASREAERGLTTITVNIGEEPGYVEGFVRAEVPDYSFIVATDTSLDTFRTYRILSFPTTFFIDSDGVIRSVRTGRLSAGAIADRLPTIQ
jgi:peroxiredoxin